MLQARHLTKTFGPLAAVADISFDLPVGQTLAILGPSGCGKSTLLALLAGLARPDSGSVLWEGQLLDDTPTHQRNFGLMFQDYALFPHLNVADNVAFGLHGPDKHRAAANMLARLDLAGFEKRDVQTLSGGEAQRVALARALAPRPRLPLLDEPPGALDRAPREPLTAELRRLLDEFGQTAIYVTHDQQEAFGIADQLLVMQNGRAIQLADPETVYRHPTTDWVRQFLGPARLASGRVAADGIHTDLGQWPAPPGDALHIGDEVTLLVRAEGVRKR